MKDSDVELDSRIDEVIERGDGWERKEDEGEKMK